MRGILTLAAQLLLPIQGTCKVLGKVVPIAIVKEASQACLAALKEPTTCVSPFLTSFIQMLLHRGLQLPEHEGDCGRSIPCRRSVTVDLKDEIATPCDSGLGKVSALVRTQQGALCPHQPGE